MQTIWEVSSRFKSLDKINLQKTYAVKFGYKDWLMRWWFAATSANDFLLKTSGQSDRMAVHSKPGQWVH